MAKDSLNIVRQTARELPPLVFAALCAVTDAAADTNALADTNAPAAVVSAVVWGTRERERTAAPAHDAPWAGAPASLAVRGQSQAGTLTDLSINGSAFSEAGMLLNGATVRNAQTEHFNADLPLPSDWMGSARTMTGLDLFRAGSGHPAGSLAVRLDDRPERGGAVSVGAGLDGLAFWRANALETGEIGSDGLSWAGAFAEMARSDRTDGYRSNPMDRAAAGGRLGLGAGDWTLDAVASWQWRDFGCTGSYGASERYPAWEEDQTSLVSARWRHDADDDQASEVSVLWTRGRDDYRLYRDNPAFYRNTHLSDSVTLHGTTRRHFSEWAFVDVRADADAEIYSTTHRTNYSGHDPKSKDETFRRFHGSFAALPGARLGGWEVALGAAGELFSGYDAVCAPAGGISYQTDDALKVELSYREGCRMPSFTELTYDSPDSKGTIDLPLQRTRSANLDLTRTAQERSDPLRSLRLGAFAMQSERLVDWLKAARTSAWKATALSPVMAFGLSGDAEWRATERLSLLPRGALVLKETSTDYWSSRYAMDFPIASLSVEATFRIVDGWRVSCRQGFEVWKHNPVRRGSDVRNVSLVETRYEIPFCRDLELSAGLSDLFSQAFEVYPGQRALGFTGHMALTYRW